MRLERTIMPKMDQLPNHCLVWSMPGNTKCSRMFYSFTFFSAITADLMAQLDDKQVDQTELRELLTSPGLQVAREQFRFFSLNFNLCFVATARVPRSGRTPKETATKEQSIKTAKFSVKLRWWRVYKDGRHHQEARDTVGAEVIYRVYIVSERESHIVLCDLVWLIGATILSFIGY